MIAIELGRLVRRRSEFIHPLVFALILVTLFPLALGPDKDVLSDLAPGILWVAALLSMQLSLDLMFREDFDSGCLEQLCFSQEPLHWLCLQKLAAFWVMTGLPLVLLSPLLGQMLFLPWDAVPVLMLSLALGTATISILGSVAAALTLCIARGGMILSLLVLPLYVPVLILGSSALVAAANGTAYLGQLAWMTAILGATIMLAPFATASALRISLDND